jgi:hypothetical protein
VSRATRRQVRELMRGSKGQALLRAAALYPALCEVLTGTVYLAHGQFLAPLHGRSVYGDHVLESSPGWPRFVVPPGVYWFGIVPVVLVTVLWVLDRPARHMPDARMLVPFFFMDAALTAMLSGAFMDLEEWPHDLWIAAIPMAVCAVVVMVVAARRRRRRRQQERRS